MAGSAQLYEKLRTQVDQQAFGRLGTPAILRRSTGDRTVTVVFSRFSSLERMGRALDPLDTKVLVSAEGLTVPPNANQDRLVSLVPGTTTEDKTYRIVERPRPMMPGGVIIYWELTVREYG